MIRGARLALHVNRFEVGLASALLLLVAVSAAIALLHLRAADPGVACWSTYWAASESARATCRGAFDAFWVAKSEADIVASPIAVALPFVVGILLGVPLVGRELELRTAVLAWSLSGDRRRWLLSRVVPALALLLIGLLAVAAVTAAMVSVANPWNYLGPGRLPRLSEVGASGLPIVGRGLLAFGVGLLAGGVAGRTLPAVAVAALVAFATVFGGMPLIQGAIAGRVVEWTAYPPMILTGAENVESEWHDGVIIPRPHPSMETPSLTWIETRFRDGDGRILTMDDAVALMRDRCPACDESSGGAWIVANLTWLDGVVPIETYPVFEAADSIAWGAAGIVCILITFPVVRRRRVG